MYDPDDVARAARCAGVKPLCLVIVMACAAPAAPAASLGNRAQPDAVACPEAQLRAFAAQFRQASLTIATTAAPDERGTVELRCALDETDGGCVARGRRKIPRQLVELDDDTRARVIDATALELTIDLDGRIETVRTRPAALPHIERMNTLLGQHMKVLSQRTVPTPEDRRAVVAYGYRRVHREATLVFPPRRGDLDDKRIHTLEHRLGVFVQTVDWDDLDEGRLVRWKVRVTCR
jgi:hypothetical protein